MTTTVDASGATAAEDLDALARAMSPAIDRVHLPGTPEYDELSAPHNLLLRPRPALVVEASSADDVVSAVRLARAFGAAVAVQSTGHGAADELAGTVLVATRGLDELAVDPYRRVARVGAGVRWQTVLDAAAPYGRHLRVQPGRRRGRLPHRRRTRAAGAQLRAVVGPRPRIRRRHRQRGAAARVAGREPRPVLGAARRPGSAGDRHRCRGRARRAAGDLRRRPVVRRAGRAGRAAHLGAVGGAAARRGHHVHRPDAAAADGGRAADDPRHRHAAAGQRRG